MSEIVSSRRREAHTAAHPCPSGPAAAALILAVGGLGLIGLALLSPRSELFFPLLSLWADLSLFVCALWVLRSAGVRLRRFHWAVLGGIWLCAALYCGWALGRRDFIYYWDYANYILKQYEMEQAFSVSVSAGLKLLRTSMVEDYTCFISLFTEFPFCLTDRTGDSYAFCMLINVFPTLLLVLAGVVCKAGQMLRVRHRRLYLGIGLSWCVTFPFLRMSAMLGQPDWFGLIFAFMILLLTLDYRFDQLQMSRCVLLFFATAAIVLTRRWYLYFVVGYYFTYVLLIFVSSFQLFRVGQRSAAARRVRNLLLYGVAAVVCILLLLWPLVVHILQYNYSSHYAYYNVGGLSAELYQQFFRIGLLNFILIGLGLAYAVRSRCPALPCLGLGQLASSILLFTRVQNTGSHQMLLFVPGWFLLFLAGAAALAEGFERHTAWKAAYWGFTLLFAVSVRCSPLTIVALPEALLEHFPSGFADEFLRLDSLLYDRRDLPQIEQVTLWLEEHCTGEDTAFCIPHDMLYNAETFQNCHLPERRVTQKLCSGFSIPGTQDFPTAYFSAKYVLTADPFPQTYVNEGELSGRMNALFLAVRDRCFTFETSFDMGNGTVISIWRRTSAPDREEVEFFRAGFAAEDAQFPELFSGAIDRWLLLQGME
ncbi:MAG: DUF3488 domain-containing protein [Faecalibacterium sp.]